MKRSAAAFAFFLIASTPPSVRAYDGFADFLYSLGLTPDYVQQKMAEEHLKTETRQAKAQTRPVKMQLAPDELKKFAELAEYICRKKSLIYTSGHLLVVAGASQGGAECPNGMRHLEVWSLAGRFLSGISYRFEITAAGSIRAWTVVEPPPNLAATGTIPASIEARIESASVQKALEEALGVWMHYPIPAS